MAIETLYPAIRPSLDLNFAGSKALDPRITFGRTSAATYYDGKTVAKAEENLLSYSQTFDNAIWDKTNVTGTANATTAPDGTSTAYALLETVTAGIHTAGQTSPVFSGNATFSVFLKANGRGFALIGNTTTAVAVDLSTGAVTSAAGSPTNLASANLGSGWWRVSYSATLGLSGVAAFIYSSTDGVFANRNFAGDVTKGIYIWGAQLEQRSQVTAYTPTTTQPITNYIPVLLTAPAGVPRFDHNPITGESLGLLIEEQRTNLLTYSEQFDTGGWTKIASSVLMNAAVAPDGSISADKLVADSAATSHRTEKSFTVVQNTAYCFSIYVKAGEHKGVSLNCAGGSSWAAFNLQTGTVNGSGGTGDASGVIGSISPIGNGWYRCNLSFTWVATGIATNFRIASSDSATVNTSQAAFIGDGYSGIYIWGAQLEVGAFPTSYIKTDASQVTRAADTASMTGTNFSSWFVQGEGTLLAEARNVVNATVFSTAVLTDDQALQTNNRLALFNRPKGVVGAAALISYQASEQIANSFTFKDTNKVGVAYKSNDVVAAANGSIAAQDASANIPNFTRLRIGQLTAGSDFFATQTIKRLVYYPKALPNSLQALTA